MSEDYNKLKVPELKDKLEALGLSTKGLKAELVARLQAVNAGEENNNNNNNEKEAITNEKNNNNNNEKEASKGKRKIQKEEKEDDEEQEEEEAEKPAKKGKAEAPKKKKVSGAKVDQYCKVPGGVVYKTDKEVFNAMLNQTNIAQNNNKFYVVQLIQSGNTYYVFTRWGRVGEPGQNQCKSYPLNSAIAEFKKKFKEKSANDWDKRDNFVPKSGKYTIVDMADDDEADEELEAKINQKMQERGHKLVKGGPKKVKACTLPESTQKLIKLIFDNDMFKEALQEMKIDLQKMPLGKISKSQIAKGFEVLEEMEEIIKKGKKGDLVALSSKFYTLIPHVFGRQIPPPIRDAETLQQKMDLLEILGDIELAQQKVQGGEDDDDDDEIPHPLDVNYRRLNNTLTPLDKKGEMWQIIQNYVDATKPGYGGYQILDIFELDRAGEKARFTKHKALGNRKLLWHGTNVAVMVAILSTGLRIMPHSGGRVGRGIYFASEHSKSAGYVRTANAPEGTVGLMILNEVALGEEYHITQDDSSLKVAPKGYDCVVAQGRTEPDATKEITIDGEFGPITVAQGKPLNRPQYAKSSFFQSEYLVYDEAQNYMRYLIKFKIN